MIEGVIGAQLLNLSAIVALRITCAENDPYTQGTPLLDFVLVLGGALGAFLGMFWFLNHMGLFGPILWLLSCLAFVMGVWPVAERARSILGLVSLIAGVLLLIVSNMRGFYLLPTDSPPPRPSFCLGCARGHY
jgi:hypothetical protein